MIAMMNTFQRETKEFVPIDVYRGDVISTEGVLFAVTGPNERPVVFEPAEILEGETGILINNLVPGTYRVWAKVIDILEVPVIDCGLFRVV